MGAEALSKCWGSSIAGRQRDATEARMQHIIITNLFILSQHKSWGTWNSPETSTIHTAINYVHLPERAFAFAASLAPTRSSLHRLANTNTWSRGRRRRCAKSIITYNRRGFQKVIQSSTSRPAAYIWQSRQSTRIRLLTRVGTWHPTHAPHLR